MERNGAAHRITGKRPAQTDMRAGGMRPMNPWFSDTNAGAHSYTNDNERNIALSVSRHPSGGYRADVSNYNRPSMLDDADAHTAGPFRTPLRAQVAAESLANLSAVDDERAARYRRPRFS